LSGGEDKDNDCPEGKVRNPNTNRCIKKYGNTWETVFGKKSHAAKPAKKPAAPKKSKSSAAKKPAAKKKKKSLEELRKLFITSLASKKDKDWDTFYKALNALYRDKFRLEKDETYYIASASKERNRPMEAYVISSKEDRTAFPVFILEKLKVPYNNRNDAIKAAEAFVAETGPYEDDYENIRFTTGSPALEIAKYISFLERK